MVLPCNAGPCHHVMGRLRFTAGGDGLQIWKVAANVLNKRSRTADKGWSSNWGRVQFEIIVN
jgi:hypothetical protein